MIDKELTGKYTDEEIQQIGLWLDQYMPNPPLSLKQRWSVGHHWIQNDEFSPSRWGIQFTDDRDATLFALRWEK